MTCGLYVNMLQQIVPTVSSNRWPLRSASYLCISTQTDSSMEVATVVRDNLWAWLNKSISSPSRIPLTIDLCLAYLSAILLVTNNIGRNRVIAMQTANQTSSQTRGEECMIITPLENQLNPHHNPNQNKHQNTFHNWHHVVSQGLSFEEEETCKTCITHNYTNSLSLAGRRKNISHRFETARGKYNPPVLLLSGWSNTCVRTGNQNELSSTDTRTRLTELSHQEKH